MKKHISDEKNASLLIAFGIITILLGAFFYALPLTMDDWKWGSVVGVQRLQELFKNYNGRYLGNLVVIIATRSRVFRALLMTAVTQLLCVQTVKIAVSRVTTPYYLLSVALLFSSVLPAFVSSRLNMLSQTIAWVSGFSNYAVPMVLVLAYVLNVKKYYLNCDLKSKASECALMLLCGICSCLFLETITFFCVASSMAVNLLFYVKRQRVVYKAQLSFLAGSVIGSVIMLSNSSYLNMLRAFVNKNEAVGSDDRAIGLVSKSIFEEFTAKMGMNPKLLMVIFAVMIVAVAVLLVLPILVTRQRAKRILLLSQALAVIVLTFPLFFANGGHSFIISIRVYFPQFVFAIIYAMALAEVIIGNRSDKLKRLLKPVPVLMLCAVITICAYAYVPLCSVYSASDKYVRAQVENKAEAVEVIKYPEKYNRFMFMADVLEYDEEWLQAYKQYYGIDDNTGIVFINYNDYLLKSKQVQ